MAGKKHLRMRGVKAAPKRTEEEFLSRSQALADNPGLLRPMCAGSCKKCAFDKTFKKIDAVRKYRNDADALLKLASRGGDDMVKAYAGTISLAAAGKIPLLATANLGGEKVPFAIRGAVGNDKLIGCEYYDDPKKRLLLYNSFIKSEKLHLYSFEAGLVCSNVPNMPEDYLYETFWETPYEFKDDEIDCGHDANVVLEIRVKSNGNTVRICENCAKDISSIRFIIGRLCAVDPIDDISVNVVHRFHKDGEDGTVRIDGDILLKYLRGELNDRTLIAHVKSEKLGDLAASGNATYIVGTKNLGGNLEAFLGLLEGAQEEKTAIEKFLQTNTRSVVLKSNKTSEFFQNIWNDSWKQIIEAYTDAATASHYSERPKASYDLVLAEARDIYVSASVVAELPEFKKLPPMARIADTMAKGAKVGGAEYAMKKLRTLSLRNSDDLAVAFSFVLACNANATPPSNLSAKGLDFAKYMVPYAKAVIDAKGRDYTDKLNVLLGSCGSGESVS